MAKVLDLKGESSKETDLPEAFLRPLRPDVIHRAFWILRSHGIQSYGRDPEAGEKTSAESGWPPTGRGISRVPRVKGERSRRSGQAAGVASVVGGRLAHPPRSEKAIYNKINKKEKKLALETAIAFTGDASAVEWRGHRIGNLEFPLVVTDDIETVSKTGELNSFFKTVGLERTKAPCRWSEEAVGEAKNEGTRLQGANRPAPRRKQRQGDREGCGRHSWCEGCHDKQSERTRPGARGRSGALDVLVGIFARRTAVERKGG